MTLHPADHLRSAPRSFVAAMLTTEARLMTMDISFTQAQVDAAKGVLAQLDGAELAFLGGSLAVGLGHAMSDIDLYVVGDGLPDRELTYQHDGTWVHVNPLPAGKVAELVALATGYRATGMDRSQLAADVKTLNALVRLVTGWRVLASPEWVARLEMLSRDTVRKILAARHANVFAAYAEDACGALRSGDLFTAATASQLALDAACEATLAAAGDLYLGPKFLFRRLARTPATAPWRDHLWRLTHRDLDSDGAIRTAVDERLRAGSQLLAWCAVDGWDQPLASLPALRQAGSQGPRRSGYFAPIRFVDGWAMIGPEDGYEVSEQIVRLWRRLDGDPLPDLYAALPGAEPQLAGYSAGEIDTALATLSELGAVEDHQASGVGQPSDTLIARESPRFSCHPKVAPAGAGQPC